MSQREEALQELARELGDQLKRQGLFLALAESCTGGLISKLVTDIPGSSAWFEAGLVTYANEAKMELLGVPEEILVEHGAVSEACAKAMAQGARSSREVDLALATTGIAGPGGGSVHKPVGTVFIALSAKDGTRAVLHKFSGNRTEVREQTAEAALKMLLDFVKAYKQR